MNSYDKPPIASRASGIFQWIVNFLKTYWVYIAVIVGIILLWRWWAGQSTLKPKCPVCPKDNQKLQGMYTILPAA